MKIQSITIQAFRGFRDKVAFNLQNANVLLLYGPNGHGKTSIYDAIEWALTGEIYRFSTASDERRRTRFIRNLHASPKENTYVTLELLVNPNLLVKVTRVCTVRANDNTDYGKHNLQIYYVDDEVRIDKGDKAEKVLRSWLINDAWKYKVEEPSRILGLTHILSQEKLNEFVRGMKDGERYNSISTLFGTEHFLKYKDSFRNINESLKEKLQVKNGQIMEVNATITNLNMYVEEVNKKIAANQNLSLNEILLSYSNKFSNVKEFYEKKEWKKLKQIILKHQEQLSIERYHLENDTQTLIDIQNLLEKWKKDKKFLKTVTKQRETLNKWQVYSRKLYEVKNLIEQYQRFQLDKIKQDNLKSDVQASQLNEQNLKRKAKFIDEFVIEVRTLIQKVIETDDFTLLVAVASLNSIDKLAKEDILKQLDIMKHTQTSLKILRKNQKINHSSLQGIKESINELQGIDRKFKEFLNSLNNYILIKNNINSCPACGTEGITTENLLTHVTSEQSKMNNKLPELEVRKNEIEKQINSHDKEIKMLEVQFNSAHISINNIMQEQNEKAIEIKDSVIKEQQKQQQLHKEMRIFKDFIHSYQQEANKLELDIHDPNFIKKLKQAESDYYSLLSSISLKDRANIIDQLDVLNKKEQQAQENINRFTNKFNTLNLTPVNIEKLDEKEVTLHISNTSKQLSELMEELQNKETITLKALNALDNANDELQLLDYRTKLNHQYEYLKNLVDERNEIEKDMGSVEEVIANLKNAVDGLNDKMISELFETVQMAFSHINSHPLYSKLQFSKEQRNKAYRLLIYVLTGQVESEIPANASYIFSSAQINSIALSLFIAMSLHQKWSPLQLIGLDDPIQSMDEINVLSFIDLMRLFIEKYDKQVIISTHDYTFYKMMLRKFRFQNVAVVEYEAYSKSGPSVKFQENNDNQYVQYIPQLKYEELTPELYHLDHKL